MIWPKHYPPNCPCPDSIDAQGIVYRLVRTLPPTPKDFKPSKIEPQDKYGDPKCLKCAISVFGELSDLNQAKDRYRHFRERVIIKFELNPRMGKIKPTPSDFCSHITWWIPEGIDPCQLFGSI